MKIVCMHKELYDNDGLLIESGEYCRDESDDYELEPWEYLKKGEDENDRATNNTSSRRGTNTNGDFNATLREQVSRRKARNNKQDNVK